MNNSGITTTRAMGIETEFGIVHANDEDRMRAGANASIRLSHYAVAGYALLEDSNKRRVRWDYGDETPLRDARGFELQRAAAHPTQLTDAVKDAHVPSVDREYAIVVGDDIPAALADSATIHFAERRAIGNAVLRNGARLYVDHAHPEYSSPEFMRAREGVVYDRAGEEIAKRTMARIAGADAIPPIALYKNNTDGKGQSYGCHENYLVSRAVGFETLTALLIPFMATRQVLVGSGRVGIGTRGEKPGFQISSRADFFEAEVGLETTLNRPIVNTRDEPHSDFSRFRRLHVIIGDANLFENSTFLKLGITSLMLAAAEYEHERGIELLPRIVLRDPVSAVHTISHDLSLSASIDTDSGPMTAIEIQRAYLEAVKSIANLDDPETHAIVSEWDDLLSILETDPSKAADRIEWVGKHTLLAAYLAKNSMGWDDPRALALDLHFSDLREDRSLYAKLKRAGRVKTIVSDAEVERAVAFPPESTRAYMRGQLVRNHATHLDSAGWDAVTVHDGEAALRLRFADPALGSRTWCEEQGIDPTADYATLVSALRSMNGS